MLDYWTVDQATTRSNPLGAPTGVDEQLAAAGGSGLASDLAVELARRRVLERMVGQISEPLRIGRFTLEEQLGSGGMGTVWRAHDERLGRLVALKFLRETEQGEIGEARLFREAQGLAKIAHPNVVPVYDVGRHAGRVWIAMEYVPGRTLRSWVEREQPPVRAIIEAWVAAGRGLAAVHAAGLVHRDVKPENAMLGDDGRIRLIDFGLVRAVDHMGDSLALTRPDSSDAHETTGGSDSQREVPTTITTHGAVIGTPAYMAPEQLKGHAATPRSDQFGFCVGLVEALTGARPYRASTVGAQLLEIEQGRPQLPEAVDRRVRRALARGLAPDPEARWPSLDALLDELERTLGLRRRRRILAGAALGLACLVGGLGLGLDRPPGLDAAGPACALTTAPLARDWNEDLGDELRASFEATELPYASASASLAISSLDRWRDAWIDQRDDICDARQLSGLQSPALLDRRGACLTRARTEFAAAIELLRDAEPEIVARVPALLAALPELHDCSAEALSAADAGPALPTQPTLARGRLLVAAGQFDAVRAVVADAELEAASADDPLIELGARELLAHIDVANGPTTRGLASLREIADDAARAGAHNYAASVRARLAVLAQGAWSQPELERWALADAELALASVASADDPRHLLVARARGLRALARADYEAAQRLLGEALAAVEAAPRSNELHALRLRMDLANVARKRGQLDGARSIYADLSAVYTERLGPRHPELGHIAYNHGVLEIDAGQFERGVELLARAREIFAATEGSDTLMGLRAELGLVRVAISRGRHAEARRSLDALLPRLEARAGPDHIDTAHAYNARGILAYFAGDYSRSLDAYAHARDGFVAALGPDHDQVGLVHANIGESLVALDRHAEALVAFDRGLDILERRLGPAHAYLGPALKGRGVARLETGAAALALDDLERALALLERSGDEPVELASTKHALARAARAVGDRERARSLAAEAAAEFHALDLSSLD